MAIDWLGEHKDFLKFKSYSDLVENLYQHAVIDSFPNLQAVVGINRLSENTIRNHLVYYLENSNSILQPYLQKKIIKLTKENTVLHSPTETRRTDIEFFMSGYGDFVIECKNLNSADRRYIDDGLLRFVNEFYSTNDSEAGMIGFIVGGSIAGIESNLLAKIRVESSFVSMCPSFAKCCTYPYSFHTIHKRQTKPNIYVHHLFIDLQ